MYYGHILHYFVFKIAAPQYSASVSASGCASNFIGKILDIAFVRLLLYVVVEPVFKDFVTVWEVCYI